MSHARRVTVLLLLLTPAAHAQEARPRAIFPAESLQARNRLRSVDRALSPFRTPQAVADTLGRDPFAIVAALLAREQSADGWDTLLDEYYRLARDAGDVLVALPESQPVWTGVQGSVRLRQVVHQRLATLPRTVLETYRRRIDVEAQHLLDAGRQGRLAEPLRRLVDEYFCSRQTA